MSRAVPPVPLSVAVAARRSAKATPSFRTTTWAPVRSEVPGLLSTMVKVVLLPVTTVLTAALMSTAVLLTNTVTESRSPSTSG